MDQSWMKRCVTVAEAEAANLLHDARLGAEPVAFGFLNAQWRELVAAMQAGDELWEFDTPEDAWKMHVGRRGYMVIRPGVGVVGEIVCRVS